jgi:hypothetical protein
MTPEALKEKKGKKEKIKESTCYASARTLQVAPS